jgi:hypothetical protein
MFFDDDDRHDVYSCRVKPFLGWTNAYLLCWINSFPTTLISTDEQIICEMPQNSLTDKIYKFRSPRHRNKIFILLYSFEKKKTIQLWRTFCQLCWGFGDLLTKGLMQNCLLNRLQTVWVEINCWQSLDIISPNRAAQTMFRWSYVSINTTLCVESATWRWIVFCTCICLGQFVRNMFHFAPLTALQSTLWLNQPTKVTMFSHQFSECSFDKKALESP